MIMRYTADGQEDDDAPEPSQNGRDSMFKLVHVQSICKNCNAHCACTYSDRTTLSEEHGGMTPQPLLDPSSPRVSLGPTRTRSLRNSGSPRESQCELAEVI